DVDSVRFFFSSRRRHTSFSRDWSSDVCSSDLATAGGGWRVMGVGWWSRRDWTAGGGRWGLLTGGAAGYWRAPAIATPLTYAIREIGRASCREGGESAGGVE